MTRHFACQSMQPASLRRDVLECSGSPWHRQVHVNMRRPRAGPPVLEDDDKDTASSNDGQERQGAGEKEATITDTVHSS